MRKVAQVMFFDTYGNLQESQGYHFFTTIEDLEEGDLLVVETQNGYKVVQFHKYLLTSSYAKSYVVQKVETEKLEEEKERAEKISQLRKKIELKAKEIEERRKLDKLAEQDDEMKELLKELDKLNK